jgi:hypothetical protein
MTSISNLALVQQYLRKYEATEEMNWRSLEGREKALGKEHPDTLMSIYCLVSYFINSNGTKPLRRSMKGQAADTNVYSVQGIPLQLHVQSLVCL